MTATWLQPASSRKPVASWRMCATPNSASPAATGSHSGLPRYHRRVLGDAGVRELTDRAWERVLDRDPVAALRCRGGQVDALPRGGPAAMEHDVSVAAGALAQLGDAGGLEAAFLRDHLTQEVA